MAKKITKTPIIREKATVEGKPKEVIEAELKEHTRKEPTSTVKLSDGTELSLKMAAHHFRAKMAHVPLSEQKIHLARYKVYRKYLGSLGRILGGNKLGDNVRGFDKRRREALELFGRMFTIEQVREIFKEEYGVRVSEVRLSQFKNANIKEIAKLQEKHKKSHDELRLTHKKSRIEELSEIYYKLKEVFMSQPSPQRLAALNSTLVAIRNEIDGDLVINGTLDINLNEQIRDHFKNEIFKTVNVKAIIMSRVAARLGLRPEVLSYELSKSFYNKLNEQAEDVAYEDITFPSQHQYDFDQIEKDYKKNQEESKQLADSLVKHNIPTEKVLDFKQKLLNRLSDGKKEVRTKKDILRAIQQINGDAK